MSLSKDGNHFIPSLENNDVKNYRYRFSIWKATLIKAF
jgi:hypothetical protein